MLQAGIVGLPNVGKSTLFNALTKTRKAEAQNYPFCTIEPNVGVVEVPDDRLYELQKIAKTNVVIPAAIEFLDIAGLVEGASRGEGLGNKFLANIREVDAIVHVVRCFDDPDIVHSMGRVDPIGDIEVIMTELVLADLESAEAQLAKCEKKAKSQDKEAALSAELLKKIVVHVNEGRPVNTLEFTDEQKERVKQFGLLTNKPILYACNVMDKELANTDENEHVKKVKAYAKEHHNASSCVISAKLEADLAELEAQEAKEFLQEYGVEDSGVSLLIKASYDLLGLASYFTAGEKEVRAWTFKKGMKAPECAGVIHSDFQKGFIKAEVVSYEDLIAAGSYQKAREAGRYRLEGKEYVFQDGDVVLFRFNN